MRSLSGSKGHMCTGVISVMNEAPPTVWLPQSVLQSYPRLGGGPSYLWGFTPLLACLYVGWGQLHPECSQAHHSHPPTFQCSGRCGRQAMREDRGHWIFVEPRGVGSARRRFNPPLNCLDFKLRADKRLVVAAGPHRLPQRLTGAPMDPGQGWATNHFSPHRV